MMVDAVVDPTLAASMVLAGAGLSLLASAALYYLLKSKSIRVTGPYLSGEGEDVVGEISPGVGSLYYGFMRRFARSLYRLLTERIHTGSLHGWFMFISSWLGFLVLLTILVLVLMLMGW
ncbi:hypothetical protein [Desulfurococcus mucosus]|uniref:Sodium:proton antiporter n=1 Tax=Desulfurococcus mucosus (strain ATCC 35584 / DSM 2162 / JCM 9187 / O7/1) TaxID=765177 RepID=E8R9D5_DESM0|nr:hypothetical protein [Desulfurococcus mucosus]ADV65111.1 hypothetical protein Desmu_0807 [Desulfurococcus mucosus DSM 2162]